jgi:multiple sugar transport system permease protein
MRRAAFWMTAPAIVTLTLVAGYPLAAALWLCLHRRILIFHQDRFIGLGNLAFLAHDARFWAALGNTAVFAAIAVPLELALALPVAVLLDQAVRGRGALRAAVLLPWAMPTVIAAKIWALLFAPETGPLARIAPSGVNWLGSPGWAMGAAIVVDVWKTTPFVALLLLAGLQAIPRDLYRAAQVDGAGPWRTFWSITLPLLRPAIALAVLFRLLDALRVFDAIYVLTQGGPANTTESLSVYAYKMLMRSGDFGYGTTLSVAAFALVLAVAALYLAGFGRSLGLKR